MSHRCVHLSCEMFCTSCVESPSSSISGFLVEASVITCQRWKIEPCLPKSKVFWKGLVRMALSQRDEWWKVQAKRGMDSQRPVTPKVPKSIEASGDAIPLGVLSMDQWGQTLLSAGKFAKAELSYAEIFQSQDPARVSYVTWMFAQRFRSDFTRQLADFARYVNVRSKAVEAKESCFEGSVVPGKFKKWSLDAWLVIDTVIEDHQDENYNHRPSGSLGALKIAKTSVNCPHVTSAGASVLKVRTRARSSSLGKDWLFRSICIYFFFKNIYHLYLYLCLF